MLKFIKEKKIAIIVAVAVIVIFFIALKMNSDGTAKTVSPVTGDLVRTVKISGKIIPAESVELGFETSGTVSSVTKNIGDKVIRGEVIAKIDASAISSNILKAEAELALAQAELDKLDGSSLYKTKVENTKLSIIQTITDAYTVANDAVYNKTDQFFLNPRSDLPDILPSFNGLPDLRNSINKERRSMESVFYNWRLLLSKLTVATYTKEDLSEAQKYFSEVFSYISNISQASNYFEDDNYLNQTTIDTYKNITLTAKDNMNSASQALISAENKLQELLFDVPIQVAKLESAQANILNYKSQFSKTFLISPLNGIVSKQDAKIGQVISPNTNLVSVISDNFEIEAFIPEVLISGVRVGNPALITLDAYRDEEIFEANIIHIDPAETVRDGVSTYKVRLTFTKPDERIRSGMTANINVEIFRKNDVVLIPERTIIKENNETFVYVLSGDKQVKTPIEIGAKDSMGNVELINGLSLENKLIINPVEN